MKKFLKEYKAFLIPFTVTIFLGSIVFIIFLAKSVHKKEIHTYENEYYHFSYDDTWKIENEEKFKTVLKHKNGSTVSIEYIPIDEQYQLRNIIDMKEQILYEVRVQNPDYRLLAEEETKVSKQLYDGYQALYENGEQQVLVVIMKNMDSILIWNYQASNDSFDILLDSFEYMLDEFSLSQEEERKNEYQEPIPVSTVALESNVDLAEELKKTKVEKTASNHQLVEYQIPNSFKSHSLDSTYGSYEYALADNNSRISLSAIVSASNIYSALDSLVETSRSSYDNKTLEIGGSYGNFKDSLGKIEDQDYAGYIYHYSYAYKSNSLETNYDEVVLLFEISKSRVFEIKLVGRNTTIPQEMINQIKIISTQNYAEYTNTEKRGDNQYTRLIQPIKDDENSQEEYVIKMPTTWKEINDDRNYNIYAERSFGLDYFTKLDYYHYRVEYSLDTISSYQTFDDVIDIVVSVKNSSIAYKKEYGNYQPLELQGKIKLNNREFYYYRGSYHELEYPVDIVVLCTGTENSVLSITLLGNDAKINNDMLKEITNFEIEEGKR